MLTLGTYEIEVVLITNEMFAISLHNQCYAKVRGQGAITSSSRATPYGGIKALNKTDFPFVEVGFVYVLIIISLNAMFKYL